MKMSQLPPEWRVDLLEQRRRDQAAARTFVRVCAGDRPLVANALRVLLLGGYSGPPLTVYRGTSNTERRRRLYGFSIDVAVARRFAEPYAWPPPSVGTSRPDQGVVLQTSAPREAVLLIRKRGDYYDEGEVVVDPFRLGRIEVVERLPAGSIQPDPRSEEKH
jgi:hypothetical protein